MRVLLLEDDCCLRRSLGQGLRADGFAVDETGTIAQAQESVDETRYDCVVLDRSVPDGDAISLLARWDAADDRPSILVVSGLGGGDSRVECLAAGADDSMVKPLSIEELILRVRKLVVRRTPGGARVRLGDVSIDRARRVVDVAGEPVRLSPLQYSVLQQLVIRAGRVVDHGWLLEHCWDARRDPFSDPLHSQVDRLRRIFRGHLVIEAARGSGYLVRAAPESPSSTPG